METLESLQLNPDIPGVILPNTEPPQTIIPDSNQFSTPGSFTLPLDLELDPVPLELETNAEQLPQEIIPNATADPLIGDLIVNQQAIASFQNAGTGLTAEYFDKLDLTNPVFTRTDATVDFDWGLGSPHPAIESDSFSVRWTGKVQPLYTETYSFHTLSNDGVRLWVNDELLIDQWVRQDTIEHGGTISLEAGQLYDIKLEYYERNGNAVSQLLWSSDSQLKEIIPTSALYPSAQLPETPSNSLELQFSTDLFYNPGETVDFIGKVSAENGTLNLERIDFFLQKDNGELIDITDATELTINPDDPDAAFFNYQLTDLEPGRYQLRAVTVDSTGNTGEPILQHFTVLSVGDGEELSDRVKQAIASAINLENYTPEQLAATKQWVVSVKDGASSQQLANDFDAQNLGETGYIPNTYFWEFPPETDPQEIASRLGEQLTIEFAYPLVPLDIEFFSSPTDEPNFDAQWHLQDAQITQVWDNYQGEGVVVGIVDDGFDITNPDLAPNYLTDLSWDFDQKDSDPSQALEFDFSQDFSRLIFAEFDNKYSLNADRISGVLSNVTVTLDITDVDIDDLEVSLISPEGTKEELSFTGNGSGTFTTSMSAFNGENPNTHPIERNYQWTLEIENEEENEGVLKNWFLTLETVNPHGTAVAGIVAASGNNGLLGTGVAPLANWVGLRLGADGFQEDEIADALSHQSQEIDIYNNSWGHGFFNKPLPLVLWSFENGTEEGRDGLGSVYVFAAGNDGHREDNVNYNSFANSRHNIAVAAIDSTGKQAFYSNPGASVLVSAYSNNTKSFFASPEREDEFDPFDPEYQELFLRKIRDGKTFSEPLPVSEVDGTITDVTVNLDISHRHYEDLEVVLVSPSGTEVELFANVPFTERDRTQRDLSDLPGVNPSISLSSSAQRRLPEIGDRPALFLGTFQPSGNLTNFIGEDANGNWQLKVKDKSGHGTSSNNKLKRWSLNISTSGIVTTDIEGEAGYTRSAENQNFGGTSASAPLVSGVTALMLEANPNLSWRDVQHILVETADKNDPSDSDWTTNGAGYHINHKYGFGAINAEKAVEMAEEWYNVGTTLSQEESIKSGRINVFDRIPDYNEFNPRSVTSTIDFEDDDTLTVEWVEVHFKAFHTYRGDLEVVLVHSYEDPETGESQTTESVLAASRGDRDRNYNWVFTTARHWGEPSTGEWTLRVSDLATFDRGIFESWKLNLFGTGEDVAEVAISSPDSDASESGDLGEFSLTLNEVLAEDLTIRYAIEGTAFNGVDYVDGNTNNSLNDTVVIPAGTTEVMIPIQPVDDAEVEGNETLILRLLDSEDYEVVDEGIATVTIVDNDVVNTPPTLTQIDALTGAVEFTPFTITYGDLQEKSDAEDADNDAISFQIESITSGTLFKDNVPVILGETLLAEGEAIIWIPESAANALPAFTVKAFDSTDYSDAAVEVAINVDAVVIPSDSWIRQLGTPGNDEGRDVTVDGLGNVYVASTTAGNLDNGNTGSLDAVLSKYDADGNLLWTEQLGSAGDDVPESVAVDVFGNLYLAGHTNGSLPGFTNLNGGQFNTDAWVAKYSADGTLEWTRQLEIAGDDLFYDVAVDNSGQVYLSGHTWSDFAGTSVGESDALIVAYDSQGNQTIAQQFGTPQADTATGIAIDEEGNLYMTGWSATFNDLDPVNPETLDVWVAKHDAEGNSLWTKTLGVSGEGDTAWDLSNDITIDSNGNVYIAGYTAGDLIDNTPIGGSDVFVAKYDNDGVREWIRQLGTPASGEHALSVVVDNVGNVRVAGFTDGDLNGEVNSGGLDAFLTTFDGQGNQVSTELVGTAANDYANGVAVDRVGNVYLTGYSEGNLEGTNAGNQDIWVSKNYVQTIVTVSATDSEASEDGDAGELTITRTGNADESLTISYEMAGDAISGTDYEEIGDLIIPAGESSVIVSLTPIDDDEVEAEETVVVNLVADIGYQLGDDSSAEVSIADNDSLDPPPILPSVTISATDANASEDGDTGEFTVTRTGGSTDNPLIVRFSTAGDAIYGTDYELLGSVLIPAAKSSTKAFQNAIDSYELSNERSAEVSNTNSELFGGADLQLFLSTDVSEVAPGNTITYTLTVLNNGSATIPPADGPVVVRDTLPPEFSVISATSAEDFTSTIIGNIVVFTAPSLSNFEVAILSIQVKVPQNATGTITNTAKIDPDNVVFETEEFNNIGSNVIIVVEDSPSTPLPDPESFTIIIPAGESSVTVPLIAIDDEQVEGDEAVVVNLVEDASYILGEDRSAQASIADSGVAAPNIVTNTNDRGAGSLRDAIIWANDNPGRDTILFNIPGDGPHTISPALRLPNITEEVLIDGWSQNGETPPDTPLIELSGSNAGTSNGLTITGSNVEVRGLAINGWQRYGIEISGASATDNWIYGNFIGTNKEGTEAIANHEHGIVISSGNNNIIGTNGDGIADEIEGNLISGNSKNGVFLLSSDANVIAGNRIGTNLEGTEAIANASHGILISSGTNNIIGTNGDEIADEIEGNLISGNSFRGVVLQSSSDANVIAGNRIGTNLEGTAAIANGTHGIFIWSAADNNIIGTNGDGIADEIEGNLISGNSANGVWLSSSEFNILAGNRIGTNLEGTAAIANLLGIGISSGNNNIIGTNGDGIADEIEGNLISGNSRSGVTLNSSESNVIAGNHIGTNLEGTEAIANGGSGIVIASGDSNNNTIGGTSAEQGNVIAFNDSDGISLYSSSSGNGNRIQGNSIFSNAGLGIDLNNNGVTANDLGDSDTGINNLQNFPELTSATSNDSTTTIQGTFNSTANTTFTLEFFSNTTLDESGYGEGQTFLGSQEITTDSEGNASFNANISTPIQVGHFITSTATDPNGNTSEFSQGVEVAVEEIGGPNIVTNTNDSGAGSLRDAIVWANNNPGRDTILFNIPGDGPHTISPTSPLPNITEGVLIDGWSQNGDTPPNTPLIELDGSNVGVSNGLTITRSNIEVRGLAVNNWKGSGIRISGVSATNNWIYGNFIGTNLDGTAAANNGGDGVIIFDGDDNIVGTNGDGVADAAETNLIAGNSGSGVDIDSDRNIVAGNIIGTNLQGTQAIANGQGGVDVSSHSNNNRIGTNGDGTADAEEANLISGNVQGGVKIRFNANFNVVAGNTIGTNLEGTEAIANGQDGISVSGNHNIIGTDGDGVADEIEGNLTSGNTDHGIELSQGNDNIVAGNLVGTNLEATEEIANSLNGLYIIAGNDNTIGGTSAEQANIIAFNNGKGVVVASGTGNRFQGNSIFSNQGLGIDLGDNGVTANDLGDGDTNQNNRQNFPELTSASSDDSTTTVQGTFNSTANTTFTLEFFSNTTLDESGYGEGETFLGSQEITTDSEGNASFNANISTPVQAGHFITSTATDPNGNTSEFSQGVEVAIFDPNQPDLKGLGFGISAGTYSAGDNVNVVYLVENDGNADANAFNVAFYLSEDDTINPSEDQLLGNEEIPGLATNSNSFNNVNLTLPEAGDAFWNGDGIYTIGMIVDSENGIGELDENNNANTEQRRDFDRLTIENTELPPNQLPIAANDAANLDAGTTATIAVLANDDDPDGDSLTLTGVSTATSGNVSISGDNVIYTPNFGFVGADSFTYTVSDGRGGMDTGTVNVTVAPPSGRVTVTINRVRDVDNIDSITDGADFFTEININNTGWWTSPEIDNQDDIRPTDWQLSQDVTRRTTVPIGIKIFDRDFFGIKDHADINPLPGNENLDLTYNLVTGEISGSGVTGTRGEEIQVRGAGDGKRADIWFTIDGPPETIIPATNWNAAFINRTNSNVSDRASYDFGNPDAVLDLGPASQDGKISLSQNWSASPASGIQSDYFAMQASTRAYFEADKLYKITTQSDDGTWFRLKNVNTGEWTGNSVVEADDGADWRDRAIWNPPTIILFQVPQTGEYDFYIDFYDRAEDAIVDVSLEEVQFFAESVNESQQWKANFLWWNRQDGNQPPTNIFASGGDPNNAIAIVNLGDNTRNDGKKGLSFDWGEGLPDDDVRLPNENFAILATTQVNFEAGRQYKVRVRGDDGFQLLAQNQNTNEWVYITPQSQWTQAYGSHQEMLFNVPEDGDYDFQVQFYEERGDANFDLSWETVNFAGTTISTIGAIVRSGPGTSYAQVDSLPLGTNLVFDKWVEGERIVIPGLGTDSSLWYRIAETDNWISAAIVDGSPEVLG